MNDKICKYKEPNYDDEDNLWKTSCGKEYGFSFDGEDYTPTDYEWNYCPNCGKKIKIIKNIVKNND